METVSAFRNKGATYFGFAAIIFSLALGLAFARPGPMILTDQGQPGLEQAAPIPPGGSQITQTFIAGHNGLSGVEVLAVVPPGEAAQASLTLKLINSSQKVIATSAFSGFKH